MCVSACVKVLTPLRQGDLIPRHNPAIGYDRIFIILRFAPQQPSGFPRPGSLSIKIYENNKNECVRERVLDFQLCKVVIT